MTEPGRAVAREIAAPKINLALHVRGRRADGRHDIETLFAFCVDGDRLEGECVPEAGLSLELAGPFAGAIEGENLIARAYDLLAARVGGAGGGVRMRLDKRLPVASGIGGGSADAAAALRLLTSLWRSDPGQAMAVAPMLGADVPACLLSLTARGEGVGDVLTPVFAEGVSGCPVLLVNPREALSTAAVFGAWDGVDRGALGEDWRGGRNDLEAAARGLVPAIGDVLAWLGAQEGVTLARMSGSGATCFGLFDSEDARDAAASACPEAWWQLASVLR